ncbi:MAG TPA: GGDEF domain-containing protein [Thermoanaerobaculia bacterium]|jgi:diguanylate cyclase (GGDEF)-like protein
MGEPDEPQRTSKLLRWLESRGPVSVSVALVLCVLALGLADWSSGYEVSFAFFYVPPVLAAAWLVGPRLVAPLSVLSAAVWQIANLQAGERLSHGWIYAWNAGTRLGFFLVCGFLLSRLRTSLTREKGLSRTDALTGLANMRAFREAAAGELLRADRYSHPVTLVALDLDDFKLVNDRLGHAAGDAALRVVAEEMLRGTRRTDCAARIGGDEFAILLPETDAEVAGAVIARLRAALLASMEFHGWPIGFSIGVLTLSQPREPLQEVLRIADAALYAAKSAGKNRVEHLKR